MWFEPRGKNNRRNRQSTHLTEESLSFAKPQRRERGLHTQKLKQCKVVTQKQAAITCNNNNYRKRKIGEKKARQKKIEFTGQENIHMKAHSSKQ